jgi:phosphoribosyl 1,2-cyclic phosphodiesterase
MSLFVASLNSGSNGNCYYVGTNDDAVLIDGGISCRETEKRMKRLGLSMRKVRAVFVSHEHGDHIHGVPSLHEHWLMDEVIFVGAKYFTLNRTPIFKSVVLRLRHSQNDMTPVIRTVLLSHPTM